MGWTPRCQHLCPWGVFNDSTVSGPSATDSMPTINSFYPMAWSFRTQEVAYVSRCMGMVAWDNPSLLTIPCWLSHGPSKMSSPDLTHNNIT